MKIFILGPVITKSYFGGVAVFDEGIAAGFQKKGWKAILVTDQPDIRQDEFREVPVCVINKKKFQKLLDAEKPDFIIAQLAYAKYLLTVKTKAIKIYFLHGFFKQNCYGKIKSELAVAYQKLLISRCDAVFSNSYFTEMVNNDFYGIKSNAVFHIGVSDKFYQSALESRNAEKEKNSIFFAGRLSSIKGINILIDAARILSSRSVSYNLYIAGDILKQDELQKRVNKYHLPVYFRGRLNQKGMVAQYSKSEIFVSLDPSEPFGIVFLEALLCRCKIVCPVTGGQIELLRKYSDNVAFVDVRSAKSVADGLQKMLEHGEKPILTQEQEESFTYQSVAGAMIDYMDTMKK